MTTRDTSGEALAEAMQGCEGDIAFWIGRRLDQCPWANDGEERARWLRKWQSAAFEAREICLANRETLVQKRTIRGGIGGAIDCLSRVLRLAKLPPSLKLDVQNTRAALERALQYATDAAAPTPDNRSSGSG